MAQEPHNNNSGFVIAPFHNHAPFQDQDLIGVAHGGEAELKWSIVEKGKYCFMRWVLPKKRPKRALLEWNHRRD